MRILVTDPRVLSSASIARIAFIICNSTVRLVSRIIVAVSCPSGASFWIIASMLMPASPSICATRHNTPGRSTPATRR